MKRIDGESLKKRARRGTKFYRVAIRQPAGSKLEDVLDWADQHGTGTYAMIGHDYLNGVWGWKFAFSRADDALEFKIRWA